MSQLEMKTPKEKTHAKFGASKSERWLSCPGSITLEENAPPQRESPYAAEGTEAHACLEFLLKNRKQLLAAKKIALKKYDPAMVEHALGAIDWILREAKNCVNPEILCETRIDASPFTCEGQFGTLDAAIIEAFGTLVVIDYKYGAGVVVDPKENSQLIYYALGISNSYGHLFSRVKLVVIQPRAFHESGETVRTWETPLEDLIAWEEKFKKGVERASDPFAPLVSGDWCRFCPAATICPELKDKALKQAQIVFSDETGIESAPEPKSIAIPNLGTILSACDKLDAWISKVRDHATHVLERGHAVEGWKLVEKRSIRRWADEEKAKNIAVKKFGSKALTKPELLSPAQLEKAIGSEKAEKFLTQYTSNKSSGTTLVPVSDKRLAVMTIETSFSIVDEPTGEEEDHMSKTKKKTARKTTAKASKTKRKTAKK